VRSLQINVQEHNQSDNELKDIYKRIIHRGLIQDSSTPHRLRYFNPDLILVSSKLWRRFSADCFPAKPQGARERSPSLNSECGSMFCAWSELPAPRFSFKMVSVCPSLHFYAHFRFFRVRFDRDSRDWLRFREFLREWSGMFSWSEFDASLVLTREICLFWFFKLLYNFLWICLETRSCCGVCQCSWDLGGFGMLLENIFETDPFLKRLYLKRGFGWSQSAFP